MEPDKILEKLGFLFLFVLFYFETGPFSVCQADTELEIILLSPPLSQMLGLEEGATISASFV